MDWMFTYETLPLARSLPTLLSFRSLLISSFSIVPCLSLENLPLILNVLHLQDQLFSSILYWWRNHCSLPSWKHSFRLLNFSLGRSSSAKILSSDLTLLIHLLIPASLLSILIMSSSLTSQVSLPCSITLRTNAKLYLVIRLDNPVMFVCWFAHAGHLD